MTTKATTSTMKASRATMTRAPSGFTSVPRITQVFHAMAKAPGRAWMMFTEMMSEIPLPTPRSVIWSPIHIRNMVPVTMMKMVVMLNMTPGAITMSGQPCMPGRLEGFISRLVSM